MLNRTIKDILKLDTLQVKLLLLLFACDLFRRVSSLMLESAASTMFLFKFDGNYIPIVFMCSAVVMALGAMHFLNIKKMPAASCAFTLMGMAMITLLLYLVYLEGYTEFASGALMVWKNVCFLLSEITFLLVALKFCKYDWRDWKFVSLLLTEALAMIVSGLAVTLLANFITPETIVAISSILLLVAGVFLLLVSRYLDEQRPAMPPKQIIKSTAPISGQIALVISFFLTLALFVFGSYVIDFGFYKAVYSMYEKSFSSDMIAFFAMYHVFAGVMVLIITAMFVRFKSLEGLRVTMLNFSFFIVVGAAGALTAGLGLLSLSRMGKDTIYRLVMTPIAKFFSVPLLPKLRAKLSFVRRVCVEPASIFVAGAILYYLDKDFSFSTLYSVLLICAIAIVLLTYLTYCCYNAVTLNALKRHSWKSGKLFLEDDELRQFIVGKLVSLDIYDTIYYLRVLDNSYGVDATGYIVYALNHPAEQVRIFALRQLEAKKEKVALPSILKVIEQDKNADVRSAALRAYCVIGGRAVYGYVEPFLNTELMEGAATGLIKSSPDGAFIAALKISQLICSQKKKDRIAVAKILGQASSGEGYYLPLKKLMWDKDKKVRVAAVNAAANLRNPSFAPDFIELLNNPDVCEYALEGLIHLGDSALPFIDVVFNNPDNKKIFYKMVAIAGRIGSNKAQDILINNSTKFPAALRLSILQDILSKSEDFSILPADSLENVINVWHFECQRKEHIENILHNLDNLPESPEDCVYLRYALYHESKQSEKIIDTLKKILEYNKDIPFNLQKSAGEKNDEAEIRTLAVCLAEVIDNKDNLHDWTVAAALYCAGSARVVTLREMIITVAAESTSHVVKETALWALCAMDLDIPEKGSLVEEKKIKYDSATVGKGGKLC